MSDCAIFERGEMAQVFSWLDSLSFKQYGNNNKKGVKQVANDDAVLKKASKIGALILFDTNSAKIKPEFTALSRLR